MDIEQELREFIATQPFKWRLRRVAKIEKYVEFLESKYPNLPFKQQYHLFDKGYDAPPTCKVCGSTDLFHNGDFNETCSYKCSNAYKKISGTIIEIQNKRAATNLKIYGSENPFGNKQIQEKIRQTNLKNLGVEHPSQSEIVREKQKQTMLKNHGVEYAGQSESGKKQKKITNLKKYGTEYAMQNPEIANKLTKTGFERWEKIVLNNITILDKILPTPNYKDLYRYAPYSLKFKCHTCNNINIINYETFRQRIELFHNPCTTCSGVTERNTSIGEIQVTQYIKNLGFNILERDILLIHPKELDIVILEKKIAIEYHGLYWHSEKYKDKNYHIDKLNLTNQAGYRLIQIFEDEWIYKSDIVKNKLAHILGCNTTKIYARNCTIQELDMEDARNFINLHHIQGYHGSRYRYGLYHNNELVSVMTFALPNKAKGGKLDGTIELDRYCSSILVVGGASKLLNYFCKSHPEWKDIFSYADRRWSEGNLYTKIGFKLEYHTAVNYWYSKAHKRIHRFSLRKNQHDNPNLTEIENRILQGYKIVWDCGSLKFKYQNPYSNT